MDQAEAEINPTWRFVDPVSVTEAAGLFTLIDPHRVERGIVYFKNHRDINEAASRSYLVTLRVLTRAIIADSLPAVLRRDAWMRDWGEEPAGDERYAEKVRVHQLDLFADHDVHMARLLKSGVIYRTEPNWNLSTVGVDDLRRFLRARGIPAPFFLAPQHEARLPDYLDPAHPRYSRKLVAAIHAWEAVTGDAGTSPKQELENYPRDHAPELGLADADRHPIQQAIEQCSQVANWGFKGGAPRTLKRSRLHH